MKQMCAVAIAVVMLAGCKDPASTQAVAISLQAEKGPAVSLQIPSGYIEQPENAEGRQSSVLLRIAAKNFTGAEAFAPESEVRILIEPNSTAADAGKELQAQALRRPKAAEDAIKKSDELSKPGLIAYSFPNGREEAESYYFTSKTGDVFVDCWKRVCKSYKTWNKLVHLRFDYQPVTGADVQAVDSAVDAMMQTFKPAAGDAK
jgi:hypothetical protein